MYNVLGNVVEQPIYIDNNNNKVNKVLWCVFVCSNEFEQKKI